jgi:tetratricopeptide (TPR) repeat protein
MPIKGSLREVGLPDVLQLLALGQKTGCLAVTDRSNFGYVYFDRGNVSYASIVNRRDRLGDLLVKNGLVEPDVLAAAVEAQGSRTAKRLGEILIERGAISRDQLERYIRVQIEEAVYHLFTWTQGSFYFETDQRPEEGAMLVSINSENLLLEGARRVDEWSLIEKKVPSFDVIFAVLPAVEEIPPDELSQAQRKIIPLLDGKRSAREVIDESGLVDFEGGKAIFGLVQAGLAHPRGRKAAATPAVPESRIQEHRNLGIAFYRTSMYQEASREFERVAELQPGEPNALFFLGLIALRSGDPRGAARRFREAAEAGVRSSATFHNLAVAFEQLGRYEDALLAVDEALRLRPDAAISLLLKGVVLARSGEYADASETLARYREGLADGARPAGAYFAFSVLAEAGCGRLDDARRIGDEGLAAFPDLAQLLLHVGAVRERAGAWDEAEVLYRRAVEEDADLAQAHKSLGDALYHRGKFEDAAEELGVAIDLEPELGPDVYFKLGNIEYKRGSREEAIRCWREALRLNPDHPIARTNLGLVEKALANAG